MSRECSGCGATTTPEARFCRRCGTPLNITGGHHTDQQPISPIAQTMPLADEGRATGGLIAEESQRLASGTSRIKRTEMDDLLRRVSREHGDGHAFSKPIQPDGAESALAIAPATSTLQPQQKDGDHSPHQTSSTQARSPRRWQWILITLLGVSIAVGLLALVSFRRWRAAGASGGNTTVVPASEQPPPVSTEAGTQAEEGTGADASTQTTAPGAPPPPLPSPPAPSSARVRDTQAASSAAAPATSETTAVPPPPALSAGQTTQPSSATPPALSPSDHYQRGLQLWEHDRRAALKEFRAAVPAVPDAYYYLGLEYYSEGRDPKSLSDGELKAALNYFLRATNGPHSAPASRSAQLLGKEYERRKKQSRR